MSHVAHPQENDAQADIPFSGYLMPHTLDKTSGEDQTGPASTQLAESFVVVASDEEGTAMADVIVTFTVSAGGGMLSANTDADPCTFESSQTSITAITDANGQASTRLTLGSEARDQHGGYLRRGAGTRALYRHRHRASLA